MTAMHVVKTESPVIKKVSPVMQKGAVASVMTDLTLEEAAAQLGRNKELVRFWVASGRLPGRKRGSMWFVGGRDLARFVKREPIRRTWSAAARQRAARRRTVGRNTK